MAASSANNMNGTTTLKPMYHLKPYQTVETVELPNIMYKSKPYYGLQERPPSSAKASKGPVIAGTKDSPLSDLELRQENVLARLEEMQASVSQLALRYKVNDTPVSSSTSVCQDGGMTSLIQPGKTLDLVVSVDPSNVPLSVVVLCQKLSKQMPVLLSTFVHSSVTAASVPSSLDKMKLPSNGSRSRADCPVAVTLIWKKVSPSPQLVVDPVHQTSIHGEANVARYLWGFLANQAGRDAVEATQEDELLDLAQLAVAEGNNKERAAALRQLNSALGKQKSWLMGGSAPSLADYVCWSSLHQAGLASQGAAPANVQRWLTGCASHPDFAPVSGVVTSSQS